MDGDPETKDWASRLEAVVGVMREGLQILDFDYRYIYVNQSAAAHGRRRPEQLIGRTLPGEYPGVEQTELWQRLELCMRERKPSSMDNEFTFPDGSKRWFELRLEPVPEGVLILSLDIQDRRNLEAQLAQSQKMEALGRLAGAVAHDFNNLLTVMISYCHFIMSGHPEGSELHRDVSEILAAADRAGRLTDQLLTLSRRRAVQERVVAINGAIGALEPILRRLVGEQVELVLELEQDAGQVLIDPGHLDQVLMNLATNARDAMPGGGLLTIRSGYRSLDADYASAHDDAVAGPHVVLTISDTGAGMDRDTVARIFEPFFTTKGGECGTGLGLATSNAIVRRARGHIRVYSEPGHGTTFRIFLPRVTEPAAVADRTARRSHTPQELRGSETILVVDDEPGLRRVCARCLGDYGYTVLEADGGDDALHFSERYSGPIHLIVTDIMMPGMTGPQLVERLREERPQVPALFVSGYAEHTVFQTVDTRCFLEKPFTPTDLARKVHDVLHQWRRDTDPPVSSPLEQ